MWRKDSEQVCQQGDQVRPTVMVPPRADGPLDQGGDGRDDEKQSDVGCALKQPAGLADRESGVESKQAVEDDSESY